MNPLDLPDRVNEAFLEFSKYGWKTKIELDVARDMLRIVLIGREKPADSGRVLQQEVSMHALESEKIRGTALRHVVEKFEKEIWTMNMEVMREEFDVMDGFDFMEFCRAQELQAFATGTPVMFPAPGALDFDPMVPYDMQDMAKALKEDKYAVYIREPKLVVRRETMLSAPREFDDQMEYLRHVQEQVEMIDSTLKSAMTRTVSDFVSLDRERRPKF